MHQTTTNTSTSYKILLIRVKEEFEHTRTLSMIIAYVTQSVVLPVASLRKPTPSKKMEQIPCQCKSKTQTHLKPFFVQSPGNSASLAGVSRKTCTSDSHRSGEMKALKPIRNSGLMCQSNQGRLLTSSRAENERATL